MTRRTFTVLPAGAALAAPANNSITVGLLGVGSRGTHVGGLFARDDRVRMTGLCDLYPEVLERGAQRFQAARPKRFRDYRELLQSDVDAVIIATPVWLHPEHFEAAVKARKHIYCEKPAGADVAGCLRIIKAAREADPSKCITFGFQNRYGAGYLKAENMLKENAIGGIKMARSNWIASTGIGKRKRPVVPPEQEKLRNWGAWREYSGDFIVEQDVHGMDVLNWFLGGPPVKAHGTGGRILRTYGDNLDHLNVTFTYPSGVNGVLTASQFGPNGYRVVNEMFMGTEGVIELTRQTLMMYRDAEHAATEKIPKDITEAAVEQFVQRVVDGKPENTAARAAETTLTCILGRMAIDAKREVTWGEMIGA